MKGIFAGIMLICFFIPIINFYFKIVDFSDLNPFYYATLFTSYALFLFFKKRSLNKKRKPIELEESVENDSFHNDFSKVNSGPSEVHVKPRNHLLEAQTVGLVESENIEILEKKS